MFDTHCQYFYNQAMITKSINIIQKKSIPLPSSWRNTRVFVSISPDSLIFKKTKPLDLASIKKKMGFAGKNISQKEISSAIKNARKQK